MSQGVTCPSCNRAYAYKPALAGKRVKCKCGGRIDFPHDELSLLDADAGGEVSLGQEAELPEPDAEAPAAVAEVAPPPLPTALCVSCRSPLATGAVLCTRCGTNQRTGTNVRTQVTAAPKPVSAPRKTYSSGSSSSGMGNMLLGGVLVVVGLAVTIGTYSAASQGGGSYYIFWGPVILGGFRFFKGLGQMMSGD